MLQCCFQRPAEGSANARRVADGVPASHPRLTRISPASHPLRVPASAAFGSVPFGVAWEGDGCHRGVGTARWSTPTGGGQGPDGALWHRARVVRRIRTRRLRGGMTTPLGKQGGFENDPCFGASVRLAWRRPNVRLRYTSGPCLRLQR